MNTTILTRHLILVRHAQAAPARPGQDDFDRALTPAGLLQCQQLGDWLESRVTISDTTVLTSPAARAIQTTRAILDGWFSGKVETDERLWAATPGAIMEVINTTPGKLVLVAHNPGLESLQRAMTGQLLPMPTAGAFELEYIDRYTARRLASFQPGSESR
ncbi:MAG: histidine phosphatase family protein [Wenzhouxiangellaceae bacterium]|nr:histidine phosphatase family protein [Wenzhouxiangellaceae bacterium]